MGKLIDKETLINAVQGAINIMQSHGIDMTCASVPMAIIQGSPAVDAVPIKPLSVWLAGYCTPPAYSLDGVPFKTEDAVKRRAEGWEQHIRNLIECGLMEDE